MAQGKGPEGGRGSGEKLRMFQLSNKWSGREAGWEENETPST